MSKPMSDGSKPLGDGGKGSVRRNEDNKSFQDGWDRIFGGNKKKGNTEMNNYDDQEDDYEICHRCNGSGEGMYDGSRCGYCKGTGEVPREKDLDDDFSDFDDRLDEDY